MRVHSLILCGFLAVSLTAAPRSSARTQTGFLDRTVAVGGATYKYQVFLPDDWSPKQKWPIILFLHGAGERGSDGLLQTDVGLGHAIRLDRSRFHTIVVMPQCLKDSWWRTAKMEEMALATLAAATKEFKGDPKRSYVTGLSMGGFGTWDIAARYPHKFAAVVPICGGIVLPERLKQMRPDLAASSYPDDPKSYEEVARKIGTTPVWMFHGSADDVVPVEGSRKLNDALKAAGGSVRYTEYPGVAHNSWDQAYAESELMPWLLAQTLK